MGLDWGTTETDIEELEIDAGAFYPAVSLARFVVDYRIPTEIPRQTLIDHLCTAIVEARHRLSTWKAGQTAETLAAVPQDTVNGEGELVNQWRRAVCCLAKGMILHETRTVNRRKDAENLAKSAEETEDKYNEMAAQSLALIQGADAVEITIL